MPLREHIRLAVEGIHLTRAQRRGDGLHAGRRRAGGAGGGAAGRSANQSGRPTRFAGAAQALRDRATRVEVSQDRLIDTCGTGGDPRTRSTSPPPPAFVAAAGGARVAKHGNRAVSSKCGSADVLAALGVEVELPPAAVVACIDECGIGFLFAPRHHAACATFAPVRKDLGLRTLFNLLGPLANPPAPGGNCSGCTRLPAGARPGEDAPGAGMRPCVRRPWRSGLDEISTAGVTLICEVRGGTVRQFELSPEDAASPARRSEGLARGDVRQNAEMLRGVLRGEKVPAARRRC